MIRVNVDLGEIKGLVEETKDAMEQAMAEAVRNLAAMGHAKAVELAGQKLHSRRQKFVDALHYEQVDANTWVISLDAKVRWIDDGMQPHNMIDDLLKSKKVKRAKDGSSYVIVPFEHGPGKGGSNTPQAQLDLVSTVKTEMKKRKIPFGKIETDAGGTPKIGKLHSFDIMKDPIKTANGPGQGKGPVGAVRQGWSKDGKSGTPFLQGVQVYQNKVKDKFGNEKVKRSIMTFRVASSKHKSQDRWNHPGTQAMNIFEDVAKWAQEMFDREIAPQILAKLGI